MKLPLLVATLLLVVPSRQAIAQRAPLTAPIASSHLAVPVDSAAVLHQLFKRSRHTGLLGLAASTGITNGINALNAPSRARQIIGGVSVGASTGLFVVAIVSQLKFSRRREREAIEQQRQHQPLRPYVQKEYTLALLKAATPRR